MTQNERITDILNSFGLICRDEYWYFPEVKTDWAASIIAQEYGCGVRLCTKVIVFNDSIHFKNPCYIWNCSELIETLDKVKKQLAEQIRILKDVKIKNKISDMEQDFEND